MPSSRKQLEDLILDLCWSLWAELGVSGWRRHHQQVAIDPEPLVVFTAALGDLDPRLRDEATDWCIANGRWVSAARLRNLLRDEPEPVREAFGELAATVAQHGKVRWPHATAPRPFRPTGRSETPDFGRPALVSLRLRALFGVGARAEVLRLFLRDPEASLPASELAPEAAFTKRNVAEALDALRMAGLLEAVPMRNQVRYRLARSRELRALLAPLPGAFPRWRPRFRVLSRVLDALSAGEDVPPLVAAVEAARALEELGADLQAAEAQPPPRGATGEELWERFRAWALDVAEAWAAPGGTPRSTSPR